MCMDLFTIGLFAPFPSILYAIACSIALEACYETLIKEFFKGAVATELFGRLTCRPLSYLLFNIHPF